MKKNFILAMVAMCMSVAAFSQVTWNVQAGMTMNNMTKVDDSKMKIGYKVGVGMDYAFSDMWSLQSGLMLVNKGFKIKTEESEEYEGERYSLEDETTYNPMYLEIPILAAAKIKISDNTKFVINAGPYLAFGVGGKWKYEWKEDGDKEEYKGKLFSDAKASYKEDGKWKDSEEKTGASMKRFDLGMHIGVGFEINKFLIGLNGEFGFMKTAKSYDENDKLEAGAPFDYKYDRETGKAEKISPKNMSFNITLGYRF